MEIHYGNSLWKSIMKIHERGTIMVAERSVCCRSRLVKDGGDIRIVNVRMSNVKRTYSAESLRFPMKGLEQHRVNWPLRV